MKAIKHKTKDITITARGWDTSTNSILATITGAMNEYSYLDETFNNFSFNKPDGGYFVSSPVVYVPDMPAIKALAEIEQSDVGRKGDDIEQTFSVAMLWESNALGLNVDDWELVII